ncbi:MAG: InlB B-repeat-containing protein, partial [Christensenellaceae bacterium]|nr:InlB B-repeat-containing protein [Christensenellaceae bacterium]
GGKSSGDVGAGALKEIASTEGSEWKLTILDKDKEFTAIIGKDAELTKAAGYSGWSIPIIWSGAGEGETVSAILCNADGKAIYYGNIGNTATSPEGFALEIPAGLSEGKYTLKVFSENLNGDKKTDYASDFSEIKFTVGTPYSITRDPSLNKYAEGLDNMPSSAAEGDKISVGIHLESSDNPPKRVYYKYGDTEVNIPVTQDGILVSGSFDMPAQNITVYAEWEVPACKVSFETNGGSDVEAQTIAIGGTATKPEDPTKDGYSFYNWFGEEACTTPFDFTQAINGDTTVYAHWLKNISGFKIHTDGTEKGSDGYYNVKADVTEVLFEKDTADVSVDVKPLSKDPADYTDPNKLKEAPEAGKEYYFHVELTDVNGKPGRPTVIDNGKLKTGTEATAENATITLMDVAHSVDETVITMVFKYVENEPEPEPDPEPKPEPEPDPEPEPAPVVKPVYWVSEGTDLTVSKDTAEGLKLTVHRKPDDQLTYSLFTGVEMGGKQLSSSDFTAESGSLKLTVKPSYIKDLAAGSYKLTVKFSDGEATANVKVTEASDNPKTGDESGLWLYVLIAVIAAGGIIAALLVYRKQSKRE